MTMDFSAPRAAGSFNDAFSELMDGAIKAHYDDRPARNYLGGSRLGEECERRLAYEYHHTPPDDGRGFTGRTYRIFDRGHDNEDRVVEYIRLAGFEMLTEKRDGSQFGFKAAKDRETGEARIAGHIDGVIVSGPKMIGNVAMKYPCLWENKCLNNQSWNDLKRHKLEKSKPVYYVQCQLYMAYMELHEAPAIFTAINANTMEIYVELVEPEPTVAHDAIMKGTRVITADSPEDLSRVADKETDFRCRFCDFQDRCWATPAPAAQAAVPFPGGAGSAAAGNPMGAWLRNSQDSGLTKPSGE